MKRQIFKALAFLLLAASALALFSCGSVLTDSTGAKETGEEIVPATEEESVAATEETVNGGGPDATDSLIRTYREAYEKFEHLYKEGHAEYCEGVARETEKLKNRIAEVNEEIVAGLKAKYELARIITPECSYEQYYENFVLPYERYYAKRISEDAMDAFLKVSNAVFYGGSGGGDPALLIDFVHYSDLLNELNSLKNLLY